MNGPAWFAFTVSSVVATFLVCWTLLVYIDVLPESERFERVYRDGMYVTVSFFVTGLLALLVGAYE